MRNPIRLLLAPLAALALLLSMLVAPGATAAPYCGIYWGSLAKVAGGDPVVHPITNVRSGRHACFDRLVVDLDGPLQAYRVRYVKAVRNIAGDTVPLRGGADLRVDVWAPVYDEDFNVIYEPKNPDKIVNVKGYRTFRQVALVHSFEGITRFGLGVRARLPFRVFQLDGPGDGSRLVIDVAHRW